MTDDCTRQVFVFLFSCGVQLSRVAHVVDKVGALRLAQDPLRSERLKKYIEGRYHFVRDLKLGETRNGVYVISRSFKRGLPPQTEGSGARNLRQKVL